MDCGSAPATGSGCAPDPRGSTWQLKLPRRPSARVGEICKPAMLPHWAQRGQIAQRANQPPHRWSSRLAATAATQFLPFLEPAEEEALLAAAPVRSYAPDELVFDQNVSLRAIFLIDKGAVRVERQDRGAMTPIAILGAGEFFGEMSFVDGTPTSARVIADETTRLIVIDTATVDALSTADPAFAGRLYRSIAAILAERLRLTSQRAYGDQSWG